MVAVSVMSPAPRSARRTGFRVAAVVALGVAAVAFFGSHVDDEAFTSLRMPSAPSVVGSGYVIMEKLPRGLVCRKGGNFGDNSYWDKYVTERAPNGRPVWNPIPVPQMGEKAYTVHNHLNVMDDKYRRWVHFDAEGKVLGRLATAISYILRGKESPLWDTNADVGHYVVVTNCEKVRISGRNYHHKLYFRNLSKMPGHTKVERFKDLQKRFPERIMMKAIWGCFPKSKMCRRIFSERLKLFMGPNHLYYHKDPIEYPMHKIKDCTHTQNLRLRDRVNHYITHRVPKVIQRRKDQTAKAEEKQLVAFKEFLKDQIEEVGPDAAARIELDELIVNANNRRNSKVLNDNVGVVIKKVEKKCYPGTTIPIVKVEVPDHRGLPAR